MQAHVRLETYKSDYGDTGMHENTWITVTF